MLKLSDRRILSIIGRRHPASYDVIPRGPQSRFSEVALNPQPLPPYELGAAIAAEFIHTVRLAERFGLDMTRVLDEVDELCPRIGRGLKLPLGWPRIPKPDPPPEWFIDFQLGFAARLAVASAESEGTPLAGTLEKAIERSIASIEAANV